MTLEFCGSFHTESQSQAGGDRVHLALCGQGVCILRGSDSIKLLSMDLITTLFSYSRKLKL